MADITKLVGTQVFIRDIAGNSSMPPGVTDITVDGFDLVNGFVFGHFGNQTIFFSLRNLGSIQRVGANTFDP